MATVTWQFSSTNFHLKVRASDGTESEVYGDKGVDEMHLSFSPVQGAATTTATTTAAASTGAASSAQVAYTPMDVTAEVPGTTHVNVEPVDITAYMSFANEDGFVDAWWRASRDGLKGKGKGKGVGKTTTTSP